MHPPFFRRWSLTIGLALCVVGCTANPGMRVLRAVDGDTLKVAMPDGRIETVRIVGINTPETVDPRKPVQCYGPEASKRMHALADGKYIALESRPGDDRDKYGRLLRYVRLGGQDLGEQMIEGGYAKSYQAFSHPRMASYNALEAKAKHAGLGLWGACPQASSHRKRLSAARHRRAAVQNF